MLPETISPKLLDMTHMFIATYARSPYRNRDEVRVETFKFVLKNGRVGVASEGYAPSNQKTVVSNITDPLANLEAIAVVKNPKTGQWMYPFVAYMPEELSDHLLDIDSYLYSDGAVHTLEAFADKYGFFAKMLPEDYAEGSPLMIGFYQSFVDAKSQTTLKEVSEAAFHDKPAPYWKTKDLYEWWQTSFGSFDDKVALFTIRDAQVDGQKLCNLDYFALEIQPEGGLKAHQVANFSDGETRRKPIHGVLEHLVFNKDFKCPMAAMSNYARLDNVFGTIGDRKVPETLWFQVPWADWEGEVEVKTANMVLMSPPEYEPYRLPEPQFFLDLLPKEFIGPSLIALGFVESTQRDSATLKEILQTRGEQLLKQAYEKAPTLNELQEKAPTLNELQEKTPIIMCDNQDETIPEDMLAGANLEPGKVYMFNHSKQKFEEVRMLEDEELAKALDQELVDPPQAEPAVDETNPEHYRNFSYNTEVIDITENLSFNGGNAVKYLARATRVDGQTKHENPIGDLKKAKWYVEREIERLEQGNE